MSIYRNVVRGCNKTLVAIGCLAAFAVPASALAQSAPWTWRVQLFQQDSGTVDAFAPFCENPDCDGLLTGQTLCITGPGVTTPNCILANVGGNTAAFSGLQPIEGTFQACIQSELYQVYGVSAGTTAVQPNCISRNYNPDTRDISNALYAFKLGTVRVEKFNDLNGNGVRDIDEGPLAGFEFTVTGTDCGPITTNAEGKASCTSANIEEGSTYEVCETPKQGWAVTGAYWGDDENPQGQTAGPCVTTGALDNLIDWTVKFGNKLVPAPVPAMGPLGLLLTAAGLSLIAGWRARRKS